MFRYLQNTRCRIPHTNKGFTLIELLVVIAIISVLAGLLMANFVGVRQRGRDAQRKSELRQIQAALELYRSDNGIYLTDAEFPSCGEALVDPGGTITYMREVPCDPLEHTNYTYISSNGLTYTISACLENANDADGESDTSSCPATGTIYELTNP